MSRKFIATVVAVAVSVTLAGQGPARADEDLARLLATVVGVAIVGAVVNNSLEKADKDRVSRNRIAYSRARPAVTPRGEVIRRARPPGHAKRFLPGDCLRSFDTRDGRLRVFGKRCLERNYDFVRSLPRACKVTFRTQGKKRQGYRARCLRRSGYYLARR